MHLILSKNSKTIKEISFEADIPVYFKNRCYESYADTVIRWGWVGNGPQADHEFNNAFAIANASNKPYCRQMLKDAGVPVPETPALNYPCIGRPSHHTKGRHFYLCRDASDVENARIKGAKYFQAFYPKTNEYRVHIADGKVIMFSIKEGDKSQLVWNRDNGFSFRNIPRGERRLDVIDVAKKAVEVMGLDFAAVDIMADPSESTLPKVVVAEVNTAPALGPTGIRRYSEFFNSLL